MLKSMAILRIDDLPEWAVETFRERAAAAKMSLPDYLRLILENAAAQEDPFAGTLSMEEWFKRHDENVAKHGRLADVTSEEIVAMIRRTRDA